jgi:predicted dehydrogenase
MNLNSLLQVFRSKRPSTPSLPVGKRVRIAVIGAGRMGTYHVGHLAKIPQAELVGIVDADSERGQKLAKKYKTTAYKDPAEIIGLAQAAVIATPTATHITVGQQLLSQGIHCLIEKPMASTVEQADTLIRIAAEKKVILQAGHIERFNPAVMEAVQHIHDPQFIEVNRLGSYDPRVNDVGVIMDLMIHDLDIVLFLVGEPVTRVEAFGAKVLSNHEDIAKVRLHFANGCIADLSASRISIEKYRKIRVFQKDAYLSLDYAASDIKIYRKKTAVVKSLLDIERFNPPLEHQDPLSAELKHFLMCILENKQPFVTGHHGRAAIALAQDVLANLKVHA